VTVLVVAIAACHSPEPERPRPSVIDVAPPTSDAGPGPIVKAEAAPSVVAAAGAGACAVHVLALANATVGAGPHSTPAREASMGHLDKKTADAWRGRDHALRHLLCTYRVEVNGTKWTYVHLAGQGFFGDERLDPASCSTPASERAVEARIHDFTHECTDPHAGAYWGFDLVP
jgi:hypothetical protein